MTEPIFDFPPPDFAPISYAPAAPINFTCAIRRIPDHLQDQAVAKAVEINPANGIPSLAAASLLALVGDSPPIRGRLALLVSKYWGPKIDHSVSFMENVQPALRDKIIAYANGWTEYANIRFRWTQSGGDVRITLVQSGYWSYLGTDCAMIPLSQPNMCLQGFSLSTPESEYLRVVQHEFGHHCGFPHEHTRPEIVQLLDRQKTIAYFQSHYGWDAQTTTEQALTPLTQGSYTGSAVSDPLSIMCYNFSGECTKNGQPIVGGSDIDPTDQAFANKCYPLTVPPPVLVDGATLVGMSAPSSVVAGQPLTFTATFRNTGTTTWSGSVANPYRFGNTSPTSPIQFRGYFTTVVRPGDEYTFIVTTSPVPLATTPGDYTLDGQMLREMLPASFFGDHATARVTVLPVAPPPPVSDVGELVLSKPRPGVVGTPGGGSLFNTGKFPVDTKQRWQVRTWKGDRPIWVVNINLCPLMDRGARADFGIHVYRGLPDDPGREKITFLGLDRYVDSDAPNNRSLSLSGGVCFVELLPNESLSLLYFANPVENQPPGATIWQAQVEASILAVYPPIANQATVEWPKSIDTSDVVVPMGAIKLPAHLPTWLNAALQFAWTFLKNLPPEDAAQLFATLFHRQIAKLTPEQKTAVQAWIAETAPGLPDWPRRFLLALSSDL